MPKTSLAEWFLARITDRTRAAAIMGDLEELAQTRGRLWFWTTYARTILALNRRAAVAFFIAVSSVATMAWFYPVWVQHTVRHLPAQLQVGMFYGQLAVASGPFLNAIAMCLWFTLPYAFMRFGLHDRLTQFACILLICTVPVYSFRIWLIDVSLILTILAIVVALLHPLWRRAFIVLALTSLTAIATTLSCFRLLAMSQHHRFQTFPQPTEFAGSQRHLLSRFPHSSVPYCTVCCFINAQPPHHPEPPMPSLPESVLALFAGPDRAAAIMGDLTEMSATRGRGWFAAAYARTLVALTWRLVLALFVADVGRQVIFDLFHLYLRHTPAVWRANTGSFADLLNSSGPLLACLMSTLWFALFFALVRYGRRDRFVHLAAVITAGTFLSFLAIPWVSLAAAVATLALAFAAFLSNSWRKPFEVLAWTGAAGLLSLAAFTILSRQFLAQHPAIAASLGSHPLAVNALVFSFQGSLLLVAVVCSRLHRLLLEPPTSQKQTPA